MQIYSSVSVKISTTLPRSVNGVSCNTDKSFLFYTLTYLWFRLFGLSGIVIRNFIDLRQHKFDENDGFSGDMAPGNSLRYLAYYLTHYLPLLYGFYGKIQASHKNAQPASLSNLCVLLSSILPSAHLGCRSPVSIFSYSACASETLTLWSYHTPLVPIKARSNSLFNSLTGTSNALTSSLVPSE